MKLFKSLLHSHTILNHLSHCKPLVPRYSILNHCNIDTNLSTLNMDIPNLGKPGQQTEYLIIFVTPYTNLIIFVTHKRIINKIIKVL